MSLQTDHHQRLRSAIKKDCQPTSQSILPNTNIRALEQHHALSMVSSRKLQLHKLLAALPQLDTKSATLEEFTILRNLPVELQNKVWYIVAHEAREVQFYGTSWGYKRRSPAIKGQPVIPPMLHVSQYVRKEGLRYYTKVLEWNPMVHPDVPIQEEVLQDGRVLKSTILHVNFAVDCFTKLECTISLDDDPNNRSIQRTNIPSSIADTSIRKIQIHGPRGLNDFVRLLDIKWSGEALEEVTIILKPMTALVESTLDQYLDRGPVERQYATMIKDDVFRLGMGKKDNVPLLINFIWGSQTVQERLGEQIWRKALRRLLLKEGE